MITICEQCFPSQDAEMLAVQPLLPCAKCGTTGPGRHVYRNDPLGGTMPDPLNTMHMAARIHRGFTINGQYDENGHWRKNKFCFMDCGSRCDCGPPMGLWYSPAHDMSLRAPDTTAKTYKPTHGGYPG
jgi:hypothetical protein